MFSHICSGDLLRCRVFSHICSGDLLRCRVLNSFDWTTSIEAFSFGTIIKPSSHKEAALRCRTQFDHNDECAGMSARNSITTIDEFRSSTSLLLLRKREASAVEPLAGVSDFGRRLRPRWTLFLRLIDFRTRRHRIEPGGGKRVRSGGVANE